MAKSETKIRWKICLLVISALLMAFLLSENALMAGAYFYNITYDCKDGICVEGKFAKWHVVIANNGKQDVEYIAIELISYNNQTPFASMSLPFYPLNSDRGNPILVRPGGRITLNITGILPKANLFHTLVYNPCFTTTITDSYIIARDNLYESRFCYSQNETMPLVGCASDIHCEKDEFCRFSKCNKLNCNSCQHLENHACVNYQCCTSDQCVFDELCKDNSCQKLNCSFSQYFLNHTCNFLNCSAGESYSDRKCSMLNCSFDEQPSNHSCKKLNCGNFEFINENKCKPLKCKESEHPKNHTCYPLKCLSGEGFLNHSCKPLNCHFFQDIVNHSCKNNWSRIIKLSLESVAVMAIASFLIIDFKKYRSKHRQ